MQQTNEEFVKLLGEGAYGFVNLVRYNNPDDNSSHLSAVKNSYQEDYNALQRELHVLLRLKGCPRIITCHEDSLQQSFSRFGEKLHKLRLEYASEGSLNAFMNNYADRKLPEPLIKDFARMILEGLVSIHDHGYVHCDIKPDNVLVFPSQDSYEVKICDFGNSLEIGEVPLCWEINFPWLGTAIYMSPESVCDGIADTSLDLWSVGCLVLEMYTGVSPWKGLELDDIAARLLSGQAPEIPESLPSAAKDFIQTCFSREPEERGSSLELLFHPFLLRPEVEEEDETKKTSDLSMLNLFKLSIRRRGSKKKLTTDAVVSDKKHLELLRFWKKRATQFKRNLNIVLRLKKSTDLFSLVFVHQGKKPLKLRFWKTKTTQFNRTLIKVLRLKKSVDFFSLVSAH
ncbi:Protein kinase domain-containing protein [Hirschfeldia incana]|nr:Protein kinase domain-containing protein [Hirschfeldia incana]